MEPEEASALAARLKNAEVSAAAANYSDVLTQFGAAADTAKAVICRPIAEVLDLFSSPQNVYTSFLARLRAGAVHAGDGIDQLRAGFESQMFPHYAEEIRFGALTLTGRGLSFWGQAGIVLKSNLISDRTTVFEENCMVFIDRHGITGVQPVPPGYRAVWEQKGSLAKAKLFHKLSGTTQHQEFSGILMHDTGNGASSDFIEAHVYGPITGHTVEEVVVTPKKSRLEKFLIQQMADKAGTFGVGVRTT